MDAVIMEGKKLSAGAVACVQNIPNPIKLARMVMEKVLKCCYQFAPKIYIIYKFHNGMLQEN